MSSSLFNHGDLYTVARSCESACRVARRQPLHVQALFGGGDGKGGLGNMANLMESMKKAQTLVQTEAARVQQELAQCDAILSFNFRSSQFSGRDQ
jgi:hypothetical protein